MNAGTTFDCQVVGQLRWVWVDSYEVAEFDWLPVGETACRLQRGKGVLGK